MHSRISLYLVGGHLALATACGAGTSRLPREEGSPPRPVAEPSARQRWDALRDGYLAEHEPPLEDNELDENETESEYAEEVLEARCREREVGTVIIGTCAFGNEFGYEDYAGWIVADEGVVELDEREIIVPVDNGDITYELTRPSLDRDPHAGLARLSHFTNRALGVVSVGPYGLEYVTIDSPDMALAATPCGEAVVETPSEEGSPLRVVAVRLADGSIAHESACAGALEEIAARAEASSLATRQALIDVTLARTPSAPPACVSPSEADLRRGRRWVLAALADDFADAEESTEDDGEDSTDDDGEDAGDYRAGSDASPPLTRVGIDAALASATAGCLDRASGSYFLTLESDDLEYAAVWEVRRSEASAVIVVRTGERDGRSGSFGPVGSVELVGNGAPELVVRTIESMSNDDEGEWSCEASYAVLVLGEGASEITTECESTIETPVPFALLAAMAEEPAAVVIAGRAWRWEDGGLVDATARYPELSRRMTERDAMREGLLAVRALIATSASDAWSQGMLASLVQAGVPETEARQLVEAALALIAGDATRE
jgi:hypothetical protein